MSDWIRRLREDRLFSAIDMAVRELLSDAAMRKLAVESVARVYVDNMAHVARRAQTEGVEAMVFFHPWRDLIRQKLGDPKRDASEEILSFKSDCLLAIKREFDVHPLARNFHDLNERLSHQDYLDSLQDTCHPDDHGQALLALEVLKRISQPVKMLMARKALI